MNQEELKNQVSAIKHQFMTFRNGIVADALRKSGMTYEIIFGLQMPQLTQIASSLPHDETIATTLWNDKKVRESRLLVAYIYPKDKLTMEKAYSMAKDLLTREEADILCFRLFRYLPFAEALAIELNSDSSELIQYCGQMLKKNLSAIS